MKKVRVAINGFGRIGRVFFRLAQTSDQIEIVAVNELGDIDNIAYLLARDTVYGQAPFSVHVEGDVLVAGKFRAKFLSEKDPSKLPWRDLNIDIVVESTGVFVEYEKAKMHLDAGAKRVVISAPAKDEPRSVPGATVLMGINEDKLRTCAITSNASCTTNAGSPLMAILDEELGIEKALLNTAHAYTASQSIVDGPNKHNLREGRAGAQNIIPSTTGAAISVTKALPHLEGRFDGISMRVPVVCGSLVDITFVAKRDTSVGEVNEILKRASEDPRWAGIFTVTEEPLVSSDIVGQTYGAIADLGLTKVVGGNLVKVCAWYDNEMGYANTLLKHVIEFGAHV